MKPDRILVVALCAGCGLGLDRPTNNGLRGTWSTPQPNGTLTMVLNPGPENVSGTATDSMTTPSGQSIDSYAVSTLPDETLRWTLTSGDSRGLPAVDFRVRIAATCLGEPLPDPARVHFIDLTTLGTPVTVIRFERSGPVPSCADVPNPP
jgi:hypothetical protein